jgi:hypothetical protein
MEGDLVLKHDSITEIDMSRSRKLSYKWLGPYRVRKAIPKKGTYILEEFDGTQLAGTYSGNQLKKFVQRSCFYVPATTDPDESSESGSEGSEGSESSDSLAEPESEVPARRSARIQENAQIRQRADPPRPGRFVIVPPTLTADQRREYVRYKEDDEGNLL